MRREVDRMHVHWRNRWREVRSAREREGVVWGEEGGRHQQNIKQIVITHNTTQITEDLILYAVGSWGDDPKFFTQFSIQLTIQLHQF